MNNVSNIFEFREIEEKNKNVIVIENLDAWKKIGLYNNIIMIKPFCKLTFFVDFKPNKFFYDTRISSSSSFYILLTPERFSYVEKCESLRESSKQRTKILKFSS